MNAEARYTLAMRTLHWLVFFSALIAVAAIEVHDLFPNRQLKYLARSQRGSVPRR